MIDSPQDNRVDFDRLQTDFDGLFDAADDLPFTDSGKIDKRSLAILIEKRVSAGA